MSFTKTHQRRLLKVAQALRESPRPKKFTMDTFVHGDGEPLTGSDKGFCGTPACALGHYGARRDLQKLMKVEIINTVAEVWDDAKNDCVEVPALEAALVYRGNVRSSTRNDDRVYYVDHQILDHFGITVNEGEELFSASGCDDARTPKQAAKYIERFVARKTRESAAAQ